MNVYGEVSALIQSLELPPAIQLAMTSRIRWSAHALLSFCTMLREKPKANMEDWRKTNWFKQHVKPMDQLVIHAILSMDRELLQPYGELVAKLSDLTAEMLSRAEANRA